jgi:PKD repeat protein
MDYTSCARMFTLGQASRMQSASNSTTGGRSNYWASANRLATGTNDGFTNSCVPTIAFSQNNALGCEGLTIAFEDNSFGADFDASWDWEWSFPGGTPSSSDDQNPTVTYNSSGTYNVTLTITNNAGTDSRTVQNAVVVTANGGGIAGGFAENVEDSGFPNNSGNDRDWSIESAGGLTWQRSELTSFTGGASVRINLRNITEGDINNLISPPIDMSNVSNSEATMTFKYAHANKNSTTHDERLRIYASDDCGETWKLRFNAAGDALNTAGALNSGIFTPDATDWVEESVSLAVVAGKEHVLVKFEATSDRQSYLYIDDININPNAEGVGIEEAGAISDMQVYPNPIDGNSQLEISMKEAVNAEISLLNVMGQTLSVNQQQLGIGINRISLSEANAFLQAGIYLVQVRSEIGTKTVRFVKN